MPLKKLSLFRLLDTGLTVSRAFYFSSSFLFPFWSVHLPGFKTGISIFHLVYVEILEEGKRGIFSRNPISRFSTLQYLLFSRRAYEIVLSRETKVPKRSFVEKIVRNISL